MVSHSIYSMYLSFILKQNKFLSGIKTVMRFFNLKNTPSVHASWQLSLLLLVVAAATVLLIVAMNQIQFSRCIRHSVCLSLTHSHSSFDSIGFVLGTYTILDDSGTHAQQISESWVVHMVLLLWRKNALEKKPNDKNAVLLCCAQWNDFEEATKNRTTERGSECVSVSE